MTQNEMKFKTIEDRLLNKPLAVDVILVNVKLIDLNSKNSSEFNDPRNFPFYYRLASEFQFSNVEQIGPQLGLIGASYMRGYKEVKEWKVAYEPNYIKSILTSNLKLNCGGEITFFTFEEQKDRIRINDAAFLTEKYDEGSQLKYMNFLWDGLKDGGLLFVDYLFDKSIKSLFDDFCLIKNRKPFIFSTRNKIGVIER